jgi:hypothetical protein
MCCVAERVFSGSAAIGQRCRVPVDYAVLSTIFPIPGGGGACLTTGGVAASRSLACCAGVDFGDVPVFGMMTWMPMLQSLMDTQFPIAASVGGRSEFCAPRTIEKQTEPVTGC